jgi:hypothetical protein
MVLHGVRWRRDWFEPAQVCENGHMVNSSTRTRTTLNKRFCSDCGAPTLTECPACGTDIQGTHHYETNLGKVPYSRSHPLSYCHECGAAYPWTERALQAARETAQIYLSPEDAETVEKNLPDVAHQTARTKIAAHLIQRAFSKGGDAAWEIFKATAAVFATEEAKTIFTHWIAH